MEIDASKIYYAFWQQSEAYDYGDGLVCLFRSNIVESEYLPKVFYRSGIFSIYEKVKMNDGKMGANPQRPRLTIVQHDNASIISENDFRKRSLATAHKEYIEIKQPA